MVRTFVPQPRAPRMSFSPRRYDQRSVIAYLKLRLHGWRSSSPGIASLDPRCYIRRKPTIREWAPGLARSIASIPQELSRE